MTKRPADGDFFVATSDQADRRLDRVLRGLYRDVPLAAIMKAIRTGEVRVNGAKSGVAYRLAERDEVRTPWQREATSTGFIAAEKAEKKFPRLATLYKDENLWCVDKPAGMLSQPDRKGGDSLITAAWAELGWTRDDFRPAAIHRLDRNVSGAVAIALNAPALRAMAEAMRLGLIRKIYRAVVVGTPPPSGRVDLPLLKDEKTNEARVDRNGRESLTLYRTLRTGRNYSLVELELVTGRPHQARAHMAAIGHPILGDAKYGDARTTIRQNKRLFLHAYALFFPQTDDFFANIAASEIIAPMPEEFEKSIT